MKKVLITGANGFIAKNISKVLKQAGFFVIGTSRVTKPVPYYDEIFYGVLGEPLKDVYEKHEIEVIIHCAYDKDDIDNIRNAEGTIIWAEQAEKNSVGLQIFISSLSADENASTPYGQKKYETEEWFLKHNHAVLRPGLVIGNGGLFQAMVSIVRKSPVIPLIDMGKTMMYLTDIDILSEIVRDTVMNKIKVERGVIWYVQQEMPFTFLEILKEICKKYKLFRIFIPIPYFAVSLLLNLTEKVKFLKLGLNINNLKGLRQLNNKKFKSDLNSLGYREYSLTTLINKSLN